MRFPTLSLVLLAGAANASPVTGIARRQDRGQYTVSGLGSRKQAILNAGGNTLDLAIAMLETETMTTDYAYVCGSRAGFTGQSESQWNNGAKLNYDIYADVASRWDCQGYYGYDIWFAGHRNGASGLANPYTEDIKTYKNAVQWIQSQIDGNPSYKTDDTRIWVDVTPI
ncbi:hypothetical protein GGR58DRAFT_516014 [Xylaria digitata]|nr:hypothetical protein GGR58DRAFT_516014 [Xylaria digitata]